MGIEPTARFWRATGFEDQGGHQTPVASDLLRRSVRCEHDPAVAAALCVFDPIEIFEKRDRVFSRDPERGAGLTCGERRLRGKGGCEAQLRNRDRVAMKQD